MTAPEISDEIIEAAARALAASQADSLAFEGEYDPDGTLEARRGWYRKHARATLTASMPLHTAQVLNQTADAWQRGEWANAPRRGDRAQERIANAQYVTDWLRSLAITHTTPKESRS